MAHREQSRVMALTNYIGQSLALGILFTGYGFRLIDRFSPIAVLAVVPFVFAAQMLLSEWWLKRHLYGPGEWMLRAVTIMGIPRWSQDGRTMRPGESPGGDEGAAEQAVAADDVTRRRCRE